MLSRRKLDTMDIASLYGTKLKALHEGNSLLQRFGFNGFSFQHIATELGIKKPSLYDHFKSKEELGNYLVQSYKEQFEAWSTTISSFTPDAQVGALFELFYKFSTDGRKLCPLAALTADYNSLPQSMQLSATHMFQCQVEWLEKCIQAGQQQKIFRGDISSESLAHTIYSLGLGAQLLARVSDNPRVIKEVKRTALQTLVLA